MCIMSLIFMFLRNRDINLLFFFKKKFCLCLEGLESIGDIVFFGKEI